MDDTPCTTEKQERTVLKEGEVKIPQKSVQSMTYINKDQEYWI